MPAPKAYDHVRHTAPQHIAWKKIRTYTTTYTRTGRTPTTPVAKKRSITLRSITKPKQVRYFQTPQGLKKYKAAHTSTTLREVIIVASTKNRKKPVDVDELEELEAIEELEELEDEDLEEDEDVEEEPEDEDDDDEDEDDAPPKRRAKAPAKKATAKKPAKSRAKENGKVGTQELAAALDVDGRTLRIVLRKHNIEKDPESNRYEWDDMDDPVVKKIIKLIKSGEAKRAKQESLDALKAKKTAQRDAAKKATSKKKSKAQVEEEEDEIDDADIEDEDDEEEEEVPVKKTRKRTAKK
jgi:hypothetical protein